MRLRRWIDSYAEANRYSAMLRYLAFLPAFIKYCLLIYCLVMCGSLCLRASVSLASSCCTAKQLDNAYRPTSLYTEYCMYLRYDNASYLPCIRFQFSCPLFPYPSMHLSIYPSIHLSIYPSLHACIQYMDIDISIHQSIHRLRMFLYSSSRSSHHLTISRSFLREHVDVCLPACLPACLYVCMSACLHVCMSACLHVCLSALANLRDPLITIHFFYNLYRNYRYKFS
jgi:hypothetical protein